MPRPSPPNTVSKLSRQCARLQDRLQQAQQTLHAIQSGQVDAIMHGVGNRARLLTLDGADSAYRALIENMSEGIVTFAADGTILYSNRRFAQILSVAPGEVVGSTVARWIAPSDWARFEELIGRAPSGDSRAELTLRSDASLVPARVSISMVQLDGNDAYSCVVADLTEQKLALLVLEQVSEAIIVCDAASIVVRASAAARALAGADPLGQAFGTAFPLRLAGQQPFDLTAVVSGARLASEATLERAHGALYFLVRAGPLSDMQQLRGCIVALTDITLRRQAQQALLASAERYRSLVLATSQIVWSADAQGYVTPDNASWGAYTGQRTLELTGDGWARALHPDDAGQAFSVWRAAVTDGTTYLARCRLLRHDCTFRYHDLRAVPVRGADGVIGEWIGVAVDIDEQQRTQLRLQAEHGVARVLAESRAPAQTMQEIITLLCITFGWDCGLHWNVNGSALRLAGSWYGAPNGGAAPILAPPQGAVKLVREVVRRRAPVWLAERAHRRATSGRVGPYPDQSALAFPVLVEARVIGVFAFFGGDIRQDDRDMQQMVATMAGQIGLFIERDQAQQVLRLRERALEASTEAVFIARCVGKRNLIEYVNPAFGVITGIAPAEALGQDLMHTELRLCREPALDEIGRALRERRVGHAITHNVRPDGSAFWSDLHIAPVRDEHGVVSHFVGIQNDVSPSMRYRSKLEHQATHDALTGLPNRNLLSDRLARAISTAQRNMQLMALVFVDLDHFKLINDTLGHDAGDVVLKTIATRLTACLRDADTAARPGGDEFLLILVDQESTDSISAVIHRILDLIAQPVVVDERKLVVTCSIGISIYLQDGDDVSTLLKNADTAMYHAKERGRNNFQFFNQAMNQRVHERFMLEEALRQAITDDALTLFYQPQIDIVSGELIGMEALLRWNHPSLGEITPARFVPIAEESGLIIAIGEWVLRTACAQSKRWQEAGLPALTVAVNLSARQFKHTQLVPMVAAALTETGLAARYLELELTESLALEDSDKFMATLTQLKALGLQLTIDDFGTGYSSLRYLKRFPLDRLKIDTSFVTDVDSDPGDAAIAISIITLGHSLNLKVLAEGVETRAQLDFLRVHGCDEIQGHLLSPALSVEQFERLLRAQTGMPCWSGVF